MDQRDNHDETEDERETRLRNEKELKEQIQIINASLFAAESILNRQRRIEDPVLRYTVFIDKLLMFVDIGVGIMKGVFTDDEKYPLELRDRMDDLARGLQNDLEDLMKWIRHPVYSPDHPYGNTIMSVSKKNFVSQRGDDDSRSDE